MNPDNINDVRKDTEFRNVTFSKFQKSKAKQELIKCLYDCKIENACYWCAEFVCAGHFLDLWDIIIFSISFLIIFIAFPAIALSPLFNSAKDFSNKVNKPFFPIYFILIRSISFRSFMWLISCFNLRLSSLAFLIISVIFFSKYRQLFSYLINYRLKRCGLMKSYMC